MNLARRGFLGLALGLPFALKQMKPMERMQPLSGINRERLMGGTWVAEMEEMYARLEFDELPEPDFSYMGVPLLYLPSMDTMEDYP